MKLRISTDRYLKALLRDREGHEDEMYPDGKDSKGRQLYSAGIGHQLTSEEVKRWKGKKIPDEIIEAWFEKDYNNALDDATALMLKEKIPYSENIFAAMSAASYQMGRTRFGKFTKTFEYLRNGNIAEAMEEAKDSEWFRGNKEKETKGTPKRVHDFNSLLDPTYDHPEKFELKDTTPFTMNFDTDMYVQRDMLGQDSSVDKLGFVNPNITSEGANARLRGRANLGFSGPMGFVDIGIDDKKNVRGEGGLYTPYGTLTGDTQENYSFQGNPFRVGDANVRLSADSTQGARLDVNRGPLNIQATEDFLRANYKNLSATLTDEQITATYNLNPNVLLSGRYSKDGDFNVGVKGRWRYQEGGEVQDDVGIPPMPKDPTQDVTIGTSPDAFVQPDPALTIRPTPSADTVDTTQGFYAYNPAPGESIEDFTTRTSSQFQYEPRETTQTGSFRPPEGYVSPRGMGTGLGGGFGSGQGTGSSGFSGTVFPPGSYPSMDTALFDTLGTISDLDATGIDYSKSDEDYLAEGIGGSKYSTYGIAQDWFTVTEDDLDILSGNYMLDKNYANKVDTWLEGTNAARAKLGKKPFTLDMAKSWISLQDDIAAFDSKFKTEIDDLGKFTFGSGKTIGAGNLVENVGGVEVDLLGAQNAYKGDWNALTEAEKTTLRNEYDNNPRVIAKQLEEQFQIPPESAQLGDPFLDDRNWFEKIGDTHLFTVGDTNYNVEVKDLYDEFATAFLVGLGTGDWEKAGIAATGQFIKSDIVGAYADKAYTTVSEAFIKNNAGNYPADSTQLKVDADAAGQEMANKWKGFGGASVAAATVLAMGGSAEDAAYAAASEALTVFAAEDVGAMFGVGDTAFGISGGEGAGAEAVGGAVIAGAIAFLRTGKLEAAAQSAATSYAFSIHPALGITMLALGFVIGQDEPSFRSGYASIDLDEFNLNTYSQGDFDAGKADPRNVNFSKTLMEPMIPYIQELEKSTGFDFKGDIQIHYSGNKAGAGAYYTIGDVDQEGLTAEQMFLNRPDYFEGKDQSTRDGGNVYRRFFQPTEIGLNLMYESLFADLEYIAKNKITDLSEYTGVIKTQEEIQQILTDSGYDTGTISNFNYGARRGGKILLDKGGNVQYNKGNYGLVNKKGKAPPSARADDVPMTLKEGDFVLSQPAVALYGEDTVNRMLSRAATDAGKNLKSGGKVPVNVHNGEYIIPKNLTEYIGPNVLETMNNRGLMSVGERPNT